jgi:hypothetical protein
VEVVRVARVELLRAVLARVHEGAGKMPRLNMRLQIALGSARLHTEAAAKQARSQRFYVDVKSVQVGA